MQNCRVKFDRPLSSIRYLHTALRLALSNEGRIRPEEAKKFLEAVEGDHLKVLYVFALTSRSSKENLLSFTLPKPPRLVPSRTFVQSSNYAIFACVS